jgi:hypothetical protein
MARIISQTEADQINREIEALNLRLPETDEESTAAWVYKHGRYQLLVVELAPHFGPPAPLFRAIDSIELHIPRRRRLRG